MKMRREPPPDTFTFKLCGWIILVWVIFTGTVRYSKGLYIEVLG